MRMHCPSATQHANCISLNYSKSACNPLHGCLSGRSALSVHKK